MSVFQLEVSSPAQHVSNKILRAKLWHSIRQPKCWYWVRSNFYALSLHNFIKIISIVRVLCNANAFRNLFTECPQNSSTKLNDVIVVNLALCSDVQVKQEATGASETPRSLNLQRVWIVPLLMKLFFLKSYHHFSRFLIIVEHPSSEQCWTKEALGGRHIGWSQSGWSKFVHGHRKDHQWGKTIARTQSNEPNNRISNIGVPFDRLHGWTRT